MHWVRSTNNPRSDRDTFVMVHLDRVCQDCCSGSPCDHNFDLEAGSTDYGAYDFDSVMHYGQCAFSVCNNCGADLTNCRTITVLPPNATTWQNAIGQRNHLSDLDLFGMAQRYGASQNQEPVAICKSHSDVADDDCSIVVDLADIDDGSFDPNGAGDIDTFCITAVDGSPVNCLQTVELSGVGEYILTITMTDDCGLASSCDATVTVLDETPPDVTCPADVTVECSAAGGVPASDPQLAGFFAGFSASDNCDANPAVIDDAPTFFDGPCAASGGVTVVTWTATDASGNSAQCSATVTVVDTTPPELSVTLNRETLWPPNHKMADISATVGVIDICDPTPTFVPNLRNQ